MNARGLSKGHTAHYHAPDGASFVEPPVVSNQP